LWLWTAAVETPMSDMYTERLLDHFRNPRNQGRLEAPDRSAEEYNALCGDQVRLELRLDGDRIEAARFSGRGCALCLGAASILAEWLEGRELAELAKLDDDAFLAQLEAPIRPARRTCALLPWVAFRRAAFGQAP
jgi:nitrogen fixation protein NifU and related proteins